MATITAKDKDIDKKKLEGEIIRIDNIEGVDDITEPLPSTDEILTLAPNLLTTQQQVEGLQWYDVMITRDSEIKADLNFRKNKVVSIPYNILWDEDDATSVTAGELVKIVLEERLGSFNDPNDFKQICSYLLTAVPKGFAVMETIFELYENYLIPVQVVDWDQTNFDYNLAGELIWITKKEGDDKGVVLPAGKFIIHCPEYTSLNPRGQSILGSSVFWAFYLKKVALKDWGQFCERFAKPYLWGTYPMSGTDTESRNKFLSNIVSLYLKRAGISVEGHNVQMLESSGQGADSLEKFIKYLDSQISLAILGQSNTTSSNNSKTGSYARDKVSKGITDEIVINDVIELQATLNRWIKFWITINFPDIETVPTIEFDTAPPENLKDKIDVYKGLQDIGVDLSLSQIRKEFNVAIPESEEDTLKKSIQSSPLNPDLDILPDDIDNEFPIQNNSKKKRVKLYKSTEFNLEAYVKGEKEQDESEQIISWTDPLIRKSAKILKPFLDDIVSKCGHITKPDQILKLQPENKVISQLEEVYLDESFFNYMFGQWRQREVLIPALNYELKQPNLMTFTTATQSPGLLYPEFIMPFENAVQFFTDKIPTLIEDLPAIEDKLRVKAFWLTKNNVMHALTRTKELLTQAMEKGLSIKDWVKENKNIFTRLGFDVKNPYYLENVHRTNILSAYSAGRYKQQTNPLAAAVLNIWRFYNPKDSRTSDVCFAMAGKMAYSIDPIWNTYYPPNHYQCRSSITAMSKAMARRYGYTVPVNKDISTPQLKNSKTGKMEVIKPLEGFQNNVGKDWLDTNQK